MITPSFGLTATERVLPKLALDFTTASLDSRITFTRTTGASNPATYTNSNGVVTAATDNQPRFDYDPVTLICKGLLIEESRTNVAAYSDQFNNVSWLKIRSSVSPDSANSPDGTANADKLIEDTTASNTHYFYRDHSGLSTATYTLSMYMKAGERTQGTLRLDQGPVTFSIFNLTGDGSVAVQAAGHTASISNVGNGWYRCVVSAAITAGTAKVGGGLALNGSASYTGDGASGIYIWGIQFELGAFATSYIPTTSAALTRNADVATMTGTNFSDWFNASEGTFESVQTLLNGTINQTNQYAFQADDGTGNNRFMTYKRSTDTSISSASVFSGNANILAAQTSPAALTQYDVAFGYKVTNFAAASNGGTPATSASGSIPTVNTMRLGHSQGPAYFLNGWLSKVDYWPQRLTNNEVRAFSKG